MYSAHIFYKKPTHYMKKEWQNQSTAQNVKISLITVEGVLLQYIVKSVVNDC